MSLYHGFTIPNEDSLDLLENDMLAPESTSFSLPKQSPPHESAFFNTRDAILPSIFVKIPYAINQQYARPKSNESAKSDPPALRQIVTPPSAAVSPSLAVGAASMAQEPIHCFKCELCAFISIQQERLNDHIDGAHSQNERNRRNRPKLACPGCDNVFYVRRVLESHLLDDHMMAADEIEALVENVVKSGRRVKKGRITIKNVKLLKKPDLIEGGAKEKSKIFVKSVQKLKEPLFATERQDEEEDGVGEEFEERPPRSTICVKSVEALRELPPASPSAMNFFQSNFATELPPPPPPTTGGIFLKDISALQDPQPPPSIHLKTVDELNNELMMLDPALLANEASLGGFSDFPDTNGDGQDDVVILDADEIDDLIYEGENYPPVEPEESLLDISDPLPQTFEQPQPVETPPKDPPPPPQKEEVKILDEQDILLVCAEEFIKADQGDPPDVPPPIELPTPPPPAQDPLDLKCSDTCSLRFRSTAVLDYHRRCHDPTTVHGIRCPECGSEDLRSWPTLHTHLWREHKVDMELHSCPLCEFRTPSASRLAKEHLPTHGDARDFRCHVCGRAFKNAKQRKNHRRAHRQDGDLLECARCSVRVRGKTELRAHMRVVHGAAASPHVEESNCDHCSRSFPTPASLRAHTRAQHAAEKRHRCDECNYATNDHNALRRHRMTHSKEAGGRYACPYCPYSSIQSTTYRRHLERQHKDRDTSALVYKCPRCTFVTINRAKFELHEARHDKGKVPAATTAPSRTTTKAAATTKEFRVLSGGDLLPPPTRTPLIRPAQFASNLSGVENLQVIEQAKIAVDGRVEFCDIDLT